MRGRIGDLEVITIDLICEVCGTHNPPGTEFCTNCKSYLAWDRSAPTNPAAQLPTVNEWPATATTVEQPVYTDVRCPSCGTINPGTRRFCSHCGYQLLSDPSLYADYGNRPRESQAAQDRAARKAYRRALPLLYRWRRVFIVVLLAALGLVAGLTLGRDPVGIVKGGWYSLTRQYELVQGVRATVEPPKASAAKSNPAAAVDGTEKEWTMKWAPRSVSECEAPEGTGVLVLTLAAPTRIRLLQIAPGVAKSNPQQDLQARPTRLGIKFDDGECNPVNLTNEDGQQEVFFDSEMPVTQVRISFAQSQSPPDAQPLISLSEVILKKHPS